MLALKIKKQTTIDTVKYFLEKSKATCTTQISEG